MIIGKIIHLNHLDFTDDWDRVVSRSNSEEMSKDERIREDEDA
jgi:hypothetical protein